MGRRQDRARVNLRGGGRHSNTMAGGRGDPRDHRREAQRLTDDFVDPAFFRIVNGRLTLAIDNKGVASLAEDLLAGGLASALAGAGLTSSGGKLGVSLVQQRPLTDSTAGTAGDTLEALPDPANTPASADALRDDIVANLLPPLRDALASLTARLNGLLEELNTPTRMA